MNKIDYETEPVFSAWEEVTHHGKIKPANNCPLGVVLGGQPGAGKSELIKQILVTFGDNFVVINGDEFRKMHPNFNELKIKYGKDYPKYTADFTGKMVEYLIKKAIANRYNIIVEGTFRTSETPIATLKSMKINGYKTKVYIQTCSKELSWRNCKERYESMYHVIKEEARWTDKNHHDLVCQNLSKNIKVVCKSGLVDEISIFFRHENNKNELLYTGIEPNTNKLDKLLGINTLNKTYNKRSNDYGIDR